ncbi:3'-5' exonuclease [Pseudoprimorskyibacter insulae]|uniref:DNA-directed DNA polymerase n=1 Tax=Pseudoprimorskyibacter insulae TaxID=1695997 RepID=A0A2R8ARM0_9RHOB|nr:3'-5' exonuclease [Pseudoprimorskyibacter insulae]SPF78514.1 DNA polymerase III PolC-type [Pseudoprimorskyibacter insulae]
MTLSSLSLRLRIFLFFILLAAGSIVVVWAALYVGHGRVAGSGATNGFVFAGILSSFLIVGLTAGIWLLFDENVAKPIERLASEMRTRAHAQVDKSVNTHAARYLGDLAPAADAVARQLNESAMSTAQVVATETARLAREKAQLTALLTEIPVATILVSQNDQIVLYDGQAAEVLAQVHVPRLNASIYDYFNAQSLSAARSKMNKSGLEVSLEAQSADGRQSYSARLKPMDGGGYLMVIDDAMARISPDAARPIVYDFDLLDQKPGRALEDTPLRDLSYVVFDTETTGLLPHKDEIVQIGAVRVINGRIVTGESIDQLVDPGMPIPPSSTKVHGVTDAMVKGKPRIAEAGMSFHIFSRNAVIVAHNAPFDMAFLRRHARDMGVVWDHPILDTVLLSAVLFGASETHTLDSLCDRLDITIPPQLRHTALGDAQATAEVLVRMLPMLEARGMKTFGDVLVQTRKHGRLLEDMN